MKPISNRRNNLYKVAVILLLAYAAFSSAMKDLNHLQEVAGNVHEVTVNGLGSLAKMYDATRSFADSPASPELASAPEVNSVEPLPRFNIIAAGGSLELTGFAGDAVSRSRSNSFAAERSHIESARFLKTNKLACDKHKDKQLSLDKWNVVAQLPRRFEFRRRDRLQQVDVVGPDDEHVRTIINKLPAKARKLQWSNVSEFKTLTDALGLAFTMTKADDTEIEAATTEAAAADNASRYVFERVIRHGADETDHSEMNK